MPRFSRIITQPARPQTSANAEVSGAHQSAAQSQGREATEPVDTNFHHQPAYGDAHMSNETAARLEESRTSFAAKTSTTVNPCPTAGAADVEAAQQALAGEASAAAAVTDLEIEAVTAPPPPPPDLTAAAFFDVDNTLVHGSSLVHFARGLAARKYFTYGDLGRFVYAQAKFQLTGRENSEDVAAGRRKALAFIEGRSTAELVAVGEEIYDEIIADKIWPGTRALAQMHLDAGQQVWLVTATPHELADTIARRLGLTGALGTVAESVDGVFTGRLVGDILHGTGKAHAVRSLAIREGLNLRRCTAYSDSFNDVPMLALVGTAVAINPDADLRDLARERGWEIRDFRTARKAARIGVPSALALGAVGGALAAIVSRRQDGS